MFDNICKFLAETFSTDFATWLLGEPITLTELSPSELSLEPIRADALILLQSDELVLHLEFQTQPKPEIPFRMIDYRLRVYRRFPNKRMRQVVVYLQPTTSELVQQTTFSLEETQHRFEVIRLWEQPTPVFLQKTGLLPFAVLSQTTDSPEERRLQRIRTLQQVAQQIESINDSRIQSNVAASALILAGLVLDEETIRQVLRRDIMQESVTYQAIKAEGKAEGSQEKARQVAIALLKEGMEMATIARIVNFSVEEVQQLAQEAENSD